MSGRAERWCASMIGAPKGTARPRRAAFGSRCIGLVAVPVSIGLATLVLPVGTSSFCSGGGPWRRSSAPVVDLPDHQGDLQCRARVGGVFCAFH